MVFNGESCHGTDSCSGLNIYKKRLQARELWKGW